MIFLNDNDYLPFCFLNSFNSGHVRRPESHALSAAACDGDHLVFGHASDREVQIPENYPVLKEYLSSLSFSLILFIHTSLLSVFLALLSFLSLFSFLSSHLSFLSFFPFSLFFLFSLFYLFFYLFYLCSFLYSLSVLSFCLIFLYSLSVLSFCLFFLSFCLVFLSFPLLFTSPFFFFFHSYFFAVICVWTFTHTIFLMFDVNVIFCFVINKKFDTKNLPFYYLQNDLFANE